MGCSASVKPSSMNHGVTVHVKPKMQTTIEEAQEYFKYNFEGWHVPGEGLPSFLLTPNVGVVFKMNTPSGMRLVQFLSIDGYDSRGDIRITVLIGTGQSFGYKPNTTLSEVWSKLVRE